MYGDIHGPTFELHIKAVINKQREQLMNSTGMNVDGNLVVHLLHISDEKNHPEKINKVTNLMVNHLVM